MKRAFDIAVVLVFAPIWVPVALSVMFLSVVFQGFPVFFVQERAGKGGRAFRLVKFRSMRPGDEPDAMRLTRFGRILRATSLDELPELVNVLRGEMALVGPRPLPIRYLPRYSPEQNRRHEVLPGITGWAQVHGRNAMTWEDKFRYDVDYVDFHSFPLDLKILLITAAQVLSSRHIRFANKVAATEFTGL